MNVQVKPAEVTPVNLVVRCFAERLPDGQWQAFSLEYGLAAQADSFAEVKQALDAMIGDYVYEALTVDKEHAVDLLSRKATFSVRLRFALHRLVDLVTNGRTVFKEAVCLPMANCPA